jgi:hypothetical protein
MSGGTRTAFVVANDAYDDPRLRRLRAPSADADELGRVLRDAEIGGFDVEVSINEPAHIVRRKLSTFFDDRGLDDLLLLHLSCHGLKDEDGRLYFATADTELDHLEATAIPSEFVNRQMTRSRSRRIVLLLDCCYSGAFATGLLSRAGDRVDIKDRFDGRGRVVLTASSAMELGRGAGSFSPARTYYTARDAHWIAVSDFNGDGKLDLAVTDVNVHSISVMLGRGDGRFRPERPYDVKTTQQGVVAVDLNRDRKPDLVMTGNDTHSLITLLNHTP